MGLLSATSIGVGAMIGAGLFALIGIAVDIAGILAIGAFLLAGTVTLLTSYSVAKLGVHYPSKAGPVEYLNQAFGRGLLSGGLNLVMWIGYVIVTAVAVLLAMKLFTDQFVPGVRQSVEDTLVQTANLLAEIAAHEATGRRAPPGIETLFKAYEQRRFEARIYGVLKSEPDLRVYVTDAAGRVVFDSRGRDVGADYSRWRDVSRTLRGEYGGL